MSHFARLVSMIRRDGKAASITVVTALGSTPREAGARMIVDHAGNFHGTIGGGSLEWQALSDVQRLMATGHGHKLTRMALGPDLGQCCGGHVSLLLEAFDLSDLAHLDALAAREAQGAFVVRAALPQDMSLGLSREILADEAPLKPSARLDDGLLTESFGERRRAVYLFGAGHVGRAVMLALAPLGFDLIWVDQRLELFPAVMPGHVTPVAAPDPADVAAKIAPGAIALVMTHSHAQDLNIAFQLLKDGLAGHVGIIGSATKRVRFERRLQDLGLPPEIATSFQCPIGVASIASREPAVIAALVAADVVLINERLSAARQHRLDVMPADTISAIPIAR